MNFTAALMHGKIWMPIDELIEFHVAEANRNDIKDDIKWEIYKNHCEFTIGSLRFIKNRLTENPTKVMTEEEFLKGGGDN